MAFYREPLDPVVFSRNAAALDDNELVGNIPKFSARCGGKSAKLLVAFESKASNCFDMFPDSCVDIDVHSVRFNKGGSCILGWPTYPSLFVPE